MTPPKLTFGLPAYKAPFLREAIDSILAQSYTDFELVIVNDASPENLDEIVQSYSDARIRYYRNAENLGKKDLVSNWNLCLSYARGEYFVLASDDDVYHKDFAVKMIELLEKYPNVDLAHCRVATINAEKMSYLFPAVVRNGKVASILFTIGQFIDEHKWLQISCAEQPP